MAHLSQCGLSVLMKVKLRTTEHKRACASNCALTSTSLSPHKSGSNGLFHTSSCLKHLDFLKVKVPDTVSHDEEICPPLRSLPQSVEHSEVFLSNYPAEKPKSVILQLINPLTISKLKTSTKKLCDCNHFGPNRGSTRYQSIPEYGPRFVPPTAITSSGLVFGNNDVLHGAKKSKKKKVPVPHRWVEGFAVQAGPLPQQTLSTMQLIGMRSSTAND